MTDADKTQIIKLKANGYGYRKIAAELKLSETAMPALSVAQSLSEENIAATNAE